MTDETAALAALLHEQICDYHWPDLLTCGIDHESDAARLIAANVRVAPSPETPGLREAAQAVVDSALLTEFGPDEEFWTVHSEALAALRAAIAAEPKP